MRQKTGRARKLAGRLARLKGRLTGRPSRPRAEPNRDTLAFLASTRCRVIAEIGTEWGATSEAIARWLNGEGRLHLFDYEDRVRPLAEGLRAKGFENIEAHGNSRCAMDSYNWSLMKLLRRHKEPIFDYVYLDGAHTWAVDALTFFLVDRLLKPGGYVDFDDYDWSIAASPTVNPRVWPAVRKLYTDEQIETPNVKLIVDLLVRRNSRYEEVVSDKIFRKLRNDGDV